MMAGGASSSAPERRFGGVVGDQSLLTASDRGVTSPELGRHQATSLTAIFPCIYLWQLLQQRRQWHPSPVVLPGKSQGWRSLVGCSPWGHQESNTTERLRFHFSLSCIGEGHGNPLQCSCLENPRDGGAWWAAIYGVTQSRTQLKRLSSSSSDFFFFWIMYSHFKIPFYFLVMICVSLLRTSHSFQECSVFPHLVL